MTDWLLRSATDRLHKLTVAYQAHPAGQHLQRHIFMSQQGDCCDIEHGWPQNGN